MSGGGVDVAWDAVGGEAFDQVRRCMAWDGRLLIVGFELAGLAGRRRRTSALLEGTTPTSGSDWGASRVMRGSRESRGHGMMDRYWQLALDGAAAPPVGVGLRPFEEAAAASPGAGLRTVGLTGKALVTI